MPLLATKLYCPPVRTKLVSRPRLIGRLEEAFKGALTLISAPAGYGKTTLIGEWRAGVGRQTPAAWLSLDENDNDLVRFLIYLAFATDTVSPGLVSQTLLLLQSSQISSSAEILTSLINEVSNYGRDFVLVLDDYHVITVPEIHTALTFLLDRLPQRMHIALLTRADPPLPLSRLRGRRLLAEIRAADLAFTQPEAIAFLNEVMNLGLPDADVAALGIRTEGWIAGLQLAALSIRDREDAPKFLRAFAGSSHYIIDYLADEVLVRQSEEVREFLLKTALLARMTGPLCDALTGSTDGQAILHQLEHANLFIIPLDGEQRWYRYHHLFADVLRKRCKQVSPEAVPELYRRAAQWCEQNDLLVEAVDYALAAHDYSLAIRLIEFSSWRLVARSDVSVLLRWMRALPQELVHSRLKLSFNYAQALIEQRCFAEAEIFLQAIERALHETSFSQSSAASQLSENTDPALSQATGRVPLLERLPILLNLLRASAAHMQDDFGGAQMYCERALLEIPSADVLDRSVAQWILGYVVLMNGDHTRATLCLQESARESAIAQHHEAHIDSLNLLGSQAMLLGNLHEALSLFTEAARYTSELPTPMPYEVQTIRMASIQRERNDLPAAAAYLSRASGQAEASHNYAYQRECYVAQAQLERAYGNMDSALHYLRKAEEVARGTQTRQGIWPIKPMQARWWIAMGNLEAAQQWASSERLLPDGVLHFRHEYGFLTLARLLLAQGHLAQADRLLARLQSFSASAGRQARVIESVMLQALVNEAAGKHPAATEKLVEALRMAEPEGYIRLFVDEGEPMRSLLAGRESQVMQSEPTLRAYVQKLLSGFPSPALQPGVGETQGLIEPLSERELEILRLVALGCSNQDIAERLVIAVGTVKRHTANIFGKLDVHNRTEAVARARQLNLV